MAAASGENRSELQRSLPSHFRFSEIVEIVSLPCLKQGSFGIIVKQGYIPNELITKTNI